MVEVPVQSRRGVSYDEKARQLSPRADGERVSAKLLIPGFQEKSRGELTGLPYRKPTQVGEEKILRRMRELSPRNSANYHRNFGRRWALGRCSRTDEADEGCRE